MSNRTTFMCPHCQIGRCQPEEITYVRMYEGMLLSVPHMLVYTCDICGYQEYEQDAIEQVQALVGDVNAHVDDAQSITKPSPLDTLDVQETSNVRRPKP